MKMNQNMKEGLLKHQELPELTFDTTRMSKMRFKKAVFSQKSQDSDNIVADVTISARIQNLKWA